MRGTRRKCYTVISSSSDVDVAERVSLMMTRGWKLHGSLSVCYHHGIQQTEMFQPMTREVKRRRKATKK